MRVTWQVPYAYNGTAGANPNIVSGMEEAIVRFHTETTIRFKLRTTEPDYLLVTAGQGCFSPIGRIGGAQVLILDESGGCDSPRVQHELAHALGLYHTHTRDDRDTYITLNANNIDPAELGNFERWTTTCGNAFGGNCALDFGSYDYNSLMHYAQKDFVAPGLPATATTFDPVSFWFGAFQTVNGPTDIGQRVGMSELDLATLSHAYDVCSDAPPAGKCACWKRVPCTSRRAAEMLRVSTRRLQLNQVDRLVCRGRKQPRVHPFRHLARLHVAWQVDCFCRRQQLLCVLHPRLWLAGGQ